MKSLSLTIQKLLKTYAVLMQTLLILMILSFILLLIGNLISFSTDTAFIKLPLSLFEAYFSIAFASLWCWYQIKIIKNSSLVLKAIEINNNSEKTKRLSHLIKFLKISFILDIIFLISSYLTQENKMDQEEYQSPLIEVYFNNFERIVEFFVPSTYGTTTVFIILILTLLLKSWNENNDLQTELDGVV